jgi:transposase
MRKRKVDPLILDRLLREGLSQREVAERFNVGEGTVSKNVRALNMAQNQDVVLRAATKINDKKLSAMTRLERISQAVETELDFIQEEMKNLKGEERREWQDTQLKHTAEIRKQLALLLEISQTLYNIEEVEAFKKIVLEEIGAIDEEARTKILERIRQRRSYSGVAGISSLGI